MTTTTNNNNNNNCKNSSNTYIYIYIYILRERDMIGIIVMLGAVLARLGGRPDLSLGVGSSDRIYQYTVYIYNMYTCIRPMYT